MAQLAPAYDQTIATGLASTNTSMQTLFAQIGKSSDAATYASQGREMAYVHVIGALKALEVQAQSRPLPPTDLLTTVNDLLAQQGKQQLTTDPKFSDYPSARAMHDAEVTLIAMQTEDARAGLHGLEVDAFENLATTYLSQAITYENFLNR
jgi:hypothetical protein